MEGKDLLGRRIAVFYDDGQEHISRKDGVCTSNTDAEVGLDNRIILLKSRIVRIEVTP